MRRPEHILKITKRIFVLFLLVIISAAFFVSLSTECSADETLLSDPSFQLLFTYDYDARGAVVQSVCVTENYIYSIENVKDDASTPDRVNVYYRNDTDENGIPVEQYSLARSDASNVWEHGNGMCYNPYTKEIYVAPYTHNIPENRGCLMVMDPDTLQPKGNIKITDSFDILSVAYDRYNRLYYIQANAEDSYANYVLDENFNIIQQLGATDPAPGYNFQAYALIGDYLIQSPLTYNLLKDNYINLYDRYSNQLIDCVLCDYVCDGAVASEPEQIYRLDDNSFILVVNTSTGGECGRAYYFKVTFPNLPVTDIMFDNTSQAADETPDEENKAAAEDINEADEQPESSGEVTITRETAEDFFEQPAADKKEKAGRNTLIALIIAAAAAASFGWYINIIRIKRARKRRDARLRRMRKQLKSRIDRELMEFDDENDKYEADEFETDDLFK